MGWVLAHKFRKLGIGHQGSEDLVIIQVDRVWGIGFREVEGVIGAHGELAGRDGDGGDRVPDQHGQVDRIS